MKQAILLADDHPIFRKGVRAIIEESPDFEILAEVGDGEACVVQAELHRPDIIVTDLNMPLKNGYEIADWVNRNLPGAKVVILSMHTDKTYVQKAVEAGAAAFVAKDDAGHELLQALMAGEKFYMSSSAGRPQPAIDLALAGQAADIERLLMYLTRTERTVLRHVAVYPTSREIAEIMGLSHRTVQTHRQNISTKLGLKGPNSLLQFAIKHKQLLASGY